MYIRVVARLPHRLQPMFLNFFLRTTPQALSGSRHSVRNFFAKTFIFYLLLSKQLGIALFCILAHYANASASKLGNNIYCIEIS